MFSSPVFSDVQRRGYQNWRDVVDSRLEVVYLVGERPYRTLIALLDHQL